MGRYAAPIIRAAIIILLLLIIFIYTRLLPDPAEAPSTPASAAFTQEDTTTTPQTNPTESATEAPTEAPAETWESLGTFTITAYCPCEICCGYWATIRPLDENGDPIVYTSTGEIAKHLSTIAVDPEVIPYGTVVKFGGHTFIAQDTGGAIKGNRIDVYLNDHKLARRFGVLEAEVLAKVEPN